MHIHGFNRLKSITIATVMGALTALAPSLGLGADIAVRHEYDSRLADLHRLFPSETITGIVATRPERNDWFGNGHIFYHPYPDDKPTIVIRIEGKIEKGDADRLEETIERITEEGRQSSTYPSMMVSFASPGGVFGEAFRIGAVIASDLESQDPRIRGVIVFAEDACLSACAIAFASSYNRAVPSVPDNRFVEAGARLGFHMPYVPEGTEMPADGGRAMLDLGYDVADAMVRLLDNNANPAELLVRTLKQRKPNTFYELRGDLETWRLGFSPVASSAKVVSIGTSGLDTASVGQLCNLRLTAGRAFMTYGEDECCDFRLGSSFGEVNQENRMMSQLFSQGGSGAMNASCDSFTCQVRVNDRDEMGIAIWRGDEGCPQSVDFPGEMCSGPAVGVERISNIFLAEAFSCRNDSLLPGTFGERARPVIKQDVNLRDAPTTSSTVIVQLKKGEIVEVEGCRITTDAQGVWYRVGASGGNGWVSARFVGGHDERYAYRGNRFSVKD